MDNHARERYLERLKSQPQPTVTPTEPAPPWQPTVFEITVLTVIVVLIVYAVIQIFRGRH